MTTDTKELLTYAAKVAGIDRLQVADHGYIAWVGGTPKNWNPATDDGDSARLRTALEISVNWFDDVVECSNDDTLVIELYADHSGDKNAALRWATLRLAAEIGRRMKDD